MTGLTSPQFERGSSLRREPALYRLTPDASEGRWDLLKVSREFDSSSGDLTETLINRLNHWAAQESSFASLRLREAEWKRFPREILLLDGSPSRLPLSAETARIAEEFLAARGLSIPIHVLNRRDELLGRVARVPRETLVLSQSAQRSLYDARLAEALVGMGAVVVPGPLTAADGPLSNKERTYELLNGGHPREDGEAGGNSHRQLAARYRAVPENGRDASSIAGAILNNVARLAEEWGESTFFVKPLQGGGGRGCFRIDVFPEGFALPDLSRLGTPQAKVSALPLSLDPENRDHVRALNWLAGRFGESPATSKAYLHLNRFPKSRRGGPATPYIRRVLRDSRPILTRRLRESAESRSRAHEKLAAAIENYQLLYGVAYRPLICEWIDFGLFSVRAHLRLGQSGPALETLYARLFPIEFTDETIGAVGVDSITNSEHGGMELNRYAPLLPQLVVSVGGAEALCERIQNAFFAFSRFVSLLSQEERERLPVRAEFDISPMNGLIPEGNADPVRAQCANSRWGRFVNNSQEWIEDALSYFSWKTRPE